MNIITLYSGWNLISEGAKAQTEHCCICKRKKTSKRKLCIHLIIVSGFGKKPPIENRNANVGGSEESEGVIIRFAKSMKVCLQSASCIKTQVFVYKSILDQKL